MYMQAHAYTYVYSSAHFQKQIKDGDINAETSSDNNKTFS